MTTKPKTKVKPAALPDFTFTRVFDAPREAVWKAWTDPRQLAAWWGPQGFTTPVCELDVRPGGTIRIHMQGPDGAIYPMGGVFREVDPPKRLVFVDTLDDGKGTFILEVLNTVTLAEEDGKTNLTLRAQVVKATAAASEPLKGMEEGWSQSLERLAAHVHGSSCVDAPKPEMCGPPSNRIVHFEWPADSPQKLAKFYADLFGWRFAQAPNPELNYWTLDTGSGHGIDGGIAKRMGKDHPSVNYVDVASIDAEIEKAVKLGAVVAFGKMAVPGVSISIACLKDPEGNMFGLLERPMDQAMVARPRKEHEWLQGLVGEWTYEGSCATEPGKPPMKSEGIETMRSLGDLWIMGESKGTMPGGGPMTAIVTLGYDPQKRRYIGTWVGSMMTNMWVYDGQMDAAGRVLTLSCDGPSMSGDGTVSRYQDIVEIKNDDHRVLRARVQRDDGTWNEFMETHYKRKR